METKILEPTQENIKKCAQEIVRGNIVAFPTETVYGLGANALSEDSVKKIYLAKGRPSDNPLIVHVANKEQILQIVKAVPEKARLLADRFMPGAITLLFDKKDCIPDCVTGGLKTVGVRMPSHPVARALIAEADVPICAPSANTSTKPSPTQAHHVLDDLNGKIEYILNGGECSIGIESTVVDARGDDVKILRLGGISVEEIESVVGRVEVVKSSIEALCPGMKYKHYAPKAEVLFSAFYDGMLGNIALRYDELVFQGKNPIIIALSQNTEFYKPRNVLDVGKDYNEYAHNLFAFLRKCDDLKFDTIIAEGVDGKGIGASIINRLVKSSGGQII